MPDAGGDATAGPQQAGGGLALALAVFAIAFFACLVARLISPPAPGVLLVWPAAGVALAFAWRDSLRWVLPAAAGAALWAWVDTRLPGATAAAFAASAAGPALAVRLMRQLGDWKPADYRLDASVRFAMLVILVAAPLDALFAALGLPASIGGAESNPIQRFAVWWLIDALGMLLVAPALLAWFGSGDRGPAAAEPPGGASQPAGSRIAAPDSAALVATAVVAGLSAALTVLGHPGFAHALLFLYFPVVAWTAIRCDERATALTLLITGLPLLALRAWQADLAGARGHESLDVAVLLFCAVIVALMLQATAADRRFALARMARQAREDMSTRLLNDRGLITEVGERLATPGRPDYGLIGLHVANFDTLNDLCGALQAMQLEQDLAAMLRRQPGLRAAARLSAGRFALLVEADSVARVRSVAREIYSQFNGQLFRTEHGSVRLQMCVGGLLVDRNAQIDSEDCIVSLSDALAIAASVRDPQLFVEPLSQTMIDARRSHQARIEQIREAIRDQRFALHAQPMIDPEAPPDKLSYEVLLRLLDRDGSLIRPPEFLTLVGQAQMTPAMDRGVIRAVFSWLAAHPEALARTWKCSINLSGLTMSDGTIAGFIREQRALHGIPAELIVFEITESEAIRNPAAASRLVDDLKAEGFGIALDDFGTGLATFEYLKRFPLDYLKIDGSFIRNLTTSPIDEEIVLSTVRVAQRLNVRTVAEHVHSREVLDRVTELGIGHLQGNLIGSACPLAELFRTASSQSPFKAPRDLRATS
ncbi:sensor domain-containing phosphodiesterase [Zeimonas arvi]|uniref:EAL domain-containing protein n=1 Tax=Zeimonas arvi TaxID=2498847 RepID=A0A5C8P1N3_9BURK|nr:EAL domain-containing protein [Zeimonas arvi]TXL67244.1 EAL domain-containing protein [Zeimonas arvi]